MFFRSFLGAPAAALALPAKPAPVKGKPVIPTCECGAQFLVRAVYDYEMPVRYGSIPADRERPLQEYMACMNGNCRYYNRPLAVPTVELAPADPRLVLAVDEFERKRLEQEGRWREEQAGREEALRVRYHRDRSSRMSVGFVPLFWPKQ